MEKTLREVHKSNEHWWFRGRRAILRVLLAKTVKWLPAEPNILDIGSGGGSLVPVLAEMGCLALIEPDPELFAHLQGVFGLKIKVVNTSLDSYQNNWKFDMVTMFDVLEHLEDESGSLSRVADLLIDSGVFVCTVPAYQFLWSAHDEQAYHKRRYTKHTLVEALEDCGFEVEYVTYFNTILFVPIAMIRLLGRVTGRTKDDFEIGLWPLNKILEVVFSLERFFLRATPLPFGVSLYCVARKLTQA